MVLGMAHRIEAKQFDLGFIRPENLVSPTDFKKMTMSFSGLPSSGSESNRTPMVCGRTEIRSTNMQLTNLQKLREAIMSTWNRISKEWFQRLVK